METGFIGLLFLFPEDAQLIVDGISLVDVLVDFDEVLQELGGQCSLVLLQEVDELVPGFEDGQVGEFEEVMQNVQLLCSQVVVLQGFGLALAQVVDISLQIEPVSQDVLVLGLHVALH